MGDGTAVITELVCRKPHTVLGHLLHKLIARELCRLDIEEEDVGRHRGWGKLQCRDTADAFSQHMHGLSRGPPSDVQCYCQWRKDHTRQARQPVAFHRPASCAHVAQGG